MTENIRNLLSKFRKENGLNPAEAESRVWLATLGHFIMPLPNYQWRREAIDVHDAHHLITGYPTSVSGELCLAAWELGVKCYGNIWARTLCGFLFLLGLASQPWKTINAFRAGQALIPLYAKYRNGRLLDAELAHIRRDLRGQERTNLWPTQQAPCKPVPRSNCQQALKR